MSYNLAHGYGQSQNSASGGYSSQYDSRSYTPSIMGPIGGQAYGAGSLYQYVETKRLPSIYVSGQYQTPGIAGGHNISGAGSDPMYNIQQPYASGYGGGSGSGSGLQQGRLLASPGYYAPAGPTVSMMKPYTHGSSPPLPGVSGSTSGYGNTYQDVFPPHSYAASSYSASSSISGPSVANDFSSHMKEKSLNIDYSSLVSYTVSPSSKRRRRERGKSEDSNSTYPCDQCGKIFQKPYNLKSHMKTHSTDKPFKCTVCSKTFARSHDKKRHEFLHGGEKNFKCEGYLRDGVTKWGCGKKFARSDALSRHFRTETGWLCIKPFMDESKESEKDPSIQQAIHEPQSNLSRDALEDNSSFIRKLIQNK